MEVKEQIINSLNLVVFLLVANTVEQNQEEKSILNEQKSTTEITTIIKSTGTSCKIVCNTKSGEGNVEELALENRNITWMWKSQNKSEWKPLLTNFSKTWHVNETSSSLILSNITMSMSGLYACFNLSHPTKPLKSVELQVKDLPQSIDEPYCYTDGFLKRMYCRGDVTDAKHLPNSYKFELLYAMAETPLEPTWNLLVSMSTDLKYNVTPCNVTKDENEDDTKKIVNCSFDLPEIRPDEENSTVVYIIWQVNNGMKTKKLDGPYPETPSVIVKPSQPTDVQVKSIEISGRSALNVTWKAPAVVSIIRLEYVVRYRHTYFKDSWHEEKISLKRNKILTDLLPYKSYDVQVSARPYQKSYEVVDGLWSEWSRKVTVKTLLQKPHRQLVFKQINATSIQVSQWKISAQWNTYENPNEPGFNYNIGYQTPADSYVHWKVFDNNSGIFLVGNTQSIELTGKICNSLGCTEPSQKILLELNDDLPPVINVELNLQNSTEFISWDLPENNFDDEECIVQICSIYRKGFTFSSIFHSKENLCNSDVQRDMDEDQKSCTNTITPCASKKAMLNLKMSPCFEYKFTVLRRKQKKFMDIFSSSQPIYHNYIPQIDQKNITFEAIDASTAKKFQIETTWELEKDSIQNLFNDDLQLSVVFAPKAGSECETRNCQNQEVFHDVVKSFSNHTIVDKVYGSTVYELGLGYCCSLLKASPSSVCFAASNKTIMLRTAPGPPGPPQKLRWKVNDRVTLLWKPPEHRNGKLSRYVIEYGTVFLSNCTNCFLSNCTNKFEQNNVSGSTHSLTISLKCNDDNLNQPYWFSIKAINDIDGVPTGGETLCKEKQVCKLKEINKNWAGFFVAIVMVFIVFAILWFMALLKRKKISVFVRKHFWPRVPVPDIFVEFDAKGEEADLLNDNLQEEEVQVAWLAESNQHSNSPERQNNKWKINAETASISSSENSSLCLDSIHSNKKQEIRRRSGVIANILLKLNDAARPRSYAGNTSLSQSHDESEFNLEQEHGNNQKIKSNAGNAIVTYSKLAVGLDGKPNLTIIKHAKSCPNGLQKEEFNCGLFLFEKEESIQSIDDYTHATEKNDGNVKQDDVNFQKSSKSFSDCKLLRNVNEYVIECEETSSDSPLINDNSRFDLAIPDQEYVSVDSAVNLASLTVPPKYPSKIFSSSKN